MSAAPPFETVDLPRWHQYGLSDQESLDERIARAEHDAGMPINQRGRQSHCWLCRREFVQEQEGRRQS